MSINTRGRVIAVAAGFLLASGAAYAGAPTPGGWAIVSDDGSLGPNANVTKVTHSRTGIYRVYFNQDVSRCAANATLAAHNGRNTVVPGYVVVGRNDDTPNQMRVFTFATVTLLPANFKFNLIVNC